MTMFSSRTLFDAVAAMRRGAATRRLAGRPVGGRGFAAAARAADRRRESDRSVAGDVLEPRVLLSGHDGDHDHDHENGLHVFAELDTSRADVQATLAGRAEGTGPQAAFDLSQTFNLASRPEATRTVYLDFTGHTTIDPWWNGGQAINTPAYDFDGNVNSFSDAELASIQEIYERVAEDFAPFDVNVTTIETSAADLSRSGNSDDRYGIRVVIGGDGAWFGPAGGVAYLYSFAASVDRPTFVFSDNTGRGFAKYTADAASHEVGHTMGLSHDGESGGDGEYYDGHGPGDEFNDNLWGPIMGTGYYASVTQFSEGDYLNATNLEDDLDIITTANGFGYVQDDHGPIGSAATVLNLTPQSNNRPTFESSGIISTRQDKDAFLLEAGRGRLDVRVDVSEFGANLNVGLELIDENGQVVASVDPQNEMGATLSADVESGTYYVVVDGVGVEAVDATKDGQRYSDYGSLGRYTISGSLPPQLLEDPNDQISEAETLMLGETVAEMIALDTDVNMYAVTLDETGILQVDIDTFASDLDTALRLFDENGNELAESLAGNNRGPGLEDDPYDPFIGMELAAGTYYIGVSQVENILYNAITGEDDVEGSTLGIYELTASIDPTPAVRFTPGPILHTEGGNPTKIFPSATIVDSDNNGDFNGTTIVARTVYGRQAGERYTINNVGGVTVQNGRVAVGSRAVATVESQGSFFSLTFDRPTNRNEAAKVLSAMHYRTASDNPVERKTAEIWVTDTTGNRATIRRDIRVTTVNDPPVLGQIRRQSTFFEDGGPIKVSGKAHIADGDLRGGTLRVEFTGIQAADRVRLDFSGPLSTTGSPTISPVTGDEIFMGGRKLADVTAVGDGDGNVVWTFELSPGTDRFHAREIFRAVTFFTLGENPDTTPRGVTFRVADDKGASDSASLPIYVRSVEDAATLSLGTDSINAPVSRAGTRLFTNASLADVDSTDFAGGRLAVGFTQGRTSFDRVRLLDNDGSRLGVGDAIRLSGRTIGQVTQTGTQLRVQLNGNATLRDVEILFNRVQYSSLAPSPSGQAGERTLRFVAIDRGNNVSFDDLTLNVGGSASSATVDAAAAALLGDDWLN